MTNHDDTPEDAGNEQKHINVNKTPIDRNTLIEGEEYTVTVEIGQVNSHNGGYNLTFEDAEGNRRSVSFLHWLTDIPKDQFQSGMRVTITHVTYEYNDPYHNLTVTEQSEVANIKGFDEESAIDDALAETTSTKASNETGHAQTTYRSEECIDSLLIHEYVIQVEPGTNPSVTERRKLAYDVVRLATHQTGTPTTKGGDLRVVSVNPLSSVDVSELEGVAGLENEGKSKLDPAIEQDNRLIKRLVEEAFKNRARECGYRVQGIDKILSHKPIDLGAPSDKFELFDRWNCTVDIGPSGRVYVHVEANTRVVSHLTLDKVSNSQLYPGRRIQAAYGSRSGYYFAGFTEEGAAEHEITPGQTVVDYHRARGGLDDSVLNDIEQSNRPAVKAYSMGSGGSYTFPQRLLALQGHTTNLTDFDSAFASAARSEWHRSPQQRVDDAHAFVCDIGEFSVDGKTVSLNTEHEVFSGDERFEFVQLYDPRENILTFANGRRGNHPDNIRDLQAYSPPKSFRVAFIYRRTFRESRLMRFGSRYRARRAASERPRLGPLT
ncbi:hypothetical protein [Haloferax sp. ATB1]|uniref:hypothetical protein n=1 Tax=Haloferax sp. ATB1 TaxID=1508454 RepID=UPI0005B209AC|nr:hypothetical protein [Haloferax sp. ATB1]